MLGQRRTAHRVLGLIGALFIASVTAAQQSDSQNLEAQGILHVGLWVTDIDETFAFLQQLSSFEKVHESTRETGGRRVFVSDDRGQIIELLTADDVEEHPDFDLHPIGKTAGVAHIAIRVANAFALRDRLASQGYRILRQVPAADVGYSRRGSVDRRIVYVEGPDKVTFELFEMKELD